MKIQLSHSEISLARRQALSLADAAGVRIVARDGVVWVTQDRDLRDVILRPGEAIVFERHGRAIVQALVPARIALSQSCLPLPATRPQPRRWFAGLAAALRRVRPPRLAWA